MAATMSAPSTDRTMYNLKPIYGDANVEVPSCMYHMQNLHNAEEMDTSDPDMKSLMEKEKKISADLVTLTDELKRLSHKLGHTFGESSPIVSKKVQIGIATPELPEGISDFVISVSPAQTALSAVLLGEYLKASGLHVATPTQKHSSLVGDIPERHLAAMGGLSGRIQHSVERVVFTFVWKDDPFCPSLMDSPLRQTRIIGDSNIGRYLCRILAPSLYDENNIEDTAMVDKWIDASVHMTNGNTKEKDSVMKSMNSHLGRNDFICGQNITLADITLLASVLTNIDYFKALPKNVKKWFLQMTTIFSDTITKYGVPETWTQQ